MAWKILALAGTAGIVAFWILMNVSLVQRFVEYGGLDEYRRGVIDFLGSEVRRERRMGIFRKGQRVGHTWLALERVAGKDTAGFHVEFSTRVNVDILGQGGSMGLEGRGTLDARMVPVKLDAEAIFGPTRLGIKVGRDGERLLVTLQSGEKILFRSLFPLQEMLLGDGLAPAIPVGGLRLGATCRVPVFDPLFRERSMAETRVVSETRRSVDGVPVDCLELETRFRGNLFRSWVTRDGELLRQELPPPLDDVVLIREPPALGPK